MSAFERSCDLLSLDSSRRLYLATFFWQLDLIFRRPLVPRYQAIMRQSFLYRSKAVSNQISSVFDQRPARNLSLPYGN